MNLPTSPIDLAQLAQTCLTHLHKEETLLGGTLHALGQMRAALVQGNSAALGQALAQQDEAVRAGEEVGQGRARLREELATVLARPAEAISLRMLLPHLPEGNRQELTRSREQVRRLAMEVDNLNRGNALLVRHSLNFLQHFLVSLTGGGQTGDRYGPAGKQQEIGCGSLIERRG